MRKLHVRRRFARLLLGATAAVTLLAACQQAPPPEVKKPRRHSFEDSNAWKPSSGSSTAPSGNATTDAQARQVQATWDQARQATSDAERQRLAGEALKQTQEMAEPASDQHQR